MTDGRRGAMFCSTSDEIVSRQTAANTLALFLKSPESKLLSEDVSHKLKVAQKNMALKEEAGQREENCFHTHIVECRFGLMATELNDAETAITRRLCAFVLGAHMMDYMGIMLAFSHFVVPKITPLKWDLPHIFVNVTVRVLVFDPAHSQVLCKLQTSDMECLQLISWMTRFVCLVVQQTVE